ncbi:phosphatidylserine decarboxylase [Nocardia sp. 852002-51101_SCH5132738]|nr:phosphatidylserine decarboxylase [Nocardia nova]OBA43956.1 phosphatidylserine decarboxylase [Nocardia sp. 852002-51101_SCH5132738]OBB52399.1 phosphatidylserine decarboxylase [Nocardia sp. 852002-51244_SCH5132740]OBF83324.1 phosphatidylserine decarboxylase [Mycobacterium sp. 852002-51759_SCH5129042]
MSEMAIAQRLRDLLDEDPDLAAGLEQSLVQARQVAEDGLKDELLEALPWPQSVAEYVDYIDDFARWVPRETDSPAWRAQAPHQRYAQEVSDRLSHFFWIIDQRPDGRDTSVAYGSDTFREWVTDFARDWGSFLDTPESFGPDVLESFIDNAPEYHVGDSLIDGKPNAPSGWMTFNQFFARELNGGLRPIAEPGSNRSIASPADCTFQHRYDIDDASNIPATTIKGTRKYGNIATLLTGSDYAEKFAGGTFTHYMLPTHAYHRFHLPVGGLVKESFVTHGQAFMQVELSDHGLKGQDNAETGFEFFQTRGVVIIDTTDSPCGDIGTVAVVCVGMQNVASVTLTCTPGKHMAKGDEFGYFTFGGSDIILLFQKGVDIDIDTAEETRLVGVPVARCR